jgi:isoaspartyl peptidase/L-asparaginase-like protein (Ntn-hydrolase superfamily)
VASKKFRLTSLFGSLPKAQAWIVQGRTGMVDNPGKPTRQVTKKTKKVIVIPDSDNDSKASEASPSSSSTPSKKESLQEEKQERKEEEGICQKGAREAKEKRKELHQTLAGASLFFVCLFH